MSNPLDEYTTPGSAPVLEEVLAKKRAAADLKAAVASIDEIGEYLPEDEDPNVLIHGPWLERGGSAFWISTAGTGKSIGSIQLAHAMSAGLPFCGLRPRGKLKFWIFQSEDSPRRVAQDRIDVRAELAEQHPDIDWNEVGKGVKMVKVTGATGSAFISTLDHLLAAAETAGDKPDVVIINPLYAFVGGPITDTAYVTPFLRGGIINNETTCGLQAVLERHAVGVLVYHHTPKPPAEKELDNWMKSAFPEYQGAGSSDITNWGRSFVTMMKVKGHPDMVCVTAGKNGAELGWERVGGAFRRYMAYSSETGVSGKGRHAWRDLTPEEYDEVVNKAKAEGEKKAEDAIAAIVDAIKKAEVAPIASSRGIEPLVEGISRTNFRTAISAILSNPGQYRLTVKPMLHPRGQWFDHIGLADNLARAVEQTRQAVEIYNRKEDINE
jgi:hypothetical protein